ncbi:MAG: mannosyltransferase family protein [Cyanobacteria bacterium P01_A01_bin.45]
MIKDKQIFLRKLCFISILWLCSRTIICVAMLLIAPALPIASTGHVPEFGWDAFYGWDSVWYHRIITVGYEYVNDGRQYSVAFFPLFPLVVKAVMSLGLSFRVAATLVNNFAFLGALIVFYFWVEEQQGYQTAKWGTTFLAWCPLSLYGTVIYTEGLFLLLSTLALRSFGKRQHLQAGIWGALSTATRSPGLALIPAFLFVAFKERRGIKAYLCAGSVSVGILLFSLYCYLKFDDAIAFIHVQRGWRYSTGFAWKGWRDMLMQVISGSHGGNTWYPSIIQTPYHLVLFALIVLSLYLLWRFSKSLSTQTIELSLFTLLLLEWLIAGSAFINITIVFGGLYLLWRYRSKIPLYGTIYALFSYVLILNTGLVLSVERYAYGITPLSYGMGLLLVGYPRWRTALIPFLAIVMAHLSIRFAQRLWVA